MTNDVDEWVQVFDGSEKPRTGLARVEGFAEVDVDVGDLVVHEEGEDVLSRIVGSRSGDRLGEDANPDRDRTDGRFLSLDCFFILVQVLFFILRRFVDPNLLETNDIYRRKADLGVAA